MIVHQLRAIAQEGLHWSGDNVHDRRRYEGILRVAAELAALTSTRGVDEIEQRFLDEPILATPFVGSEGAVFDDDGRLLLIRREDNRLWALPGGASDVGETGAQTAVREVFEETGIQTKPTLFVGIYDSRLVGTISKAHLYHLVFICEMDDEQTPIAGPETIDVGWFARDELPELSPGHPIRISDVFAMRRGIRTRTFFDGEPTG